MNVLLTGASGFTGSHVLARMLDAGMRPRCLVRPSSDRALLEREGVELVEGDLGDADSLRRALDGIDTLVNTASIGFGHGPGLVTEAERAGVRRAIFVSTTAVFTTLNAASKSVRLAAESAIASSSLDYTILRPTMIYGTSRDRNMVRLIRYLHRWRVLPVAGDGERLLQPVHVGDVAAAIMQSLDAPAAARRAYNISGAAPLTFNQVVRTIAGMMKRRVWTVHLPLALPVVALQTIERAGLRLPIRAEQLLRLNEDKAFDHAEAARDFGYAPRSFDDGIRGEIAELGFLAA